MRNSPYDETTTANRIASDHFIIELEITANDWPISTEH